MSSYWKIPKLWPESVVYIIGGGPSFREMRDTVMGTIAGIRDKQGLNRARIIGCNDAYLLGPMVDLCWFGDYSWFVHHCKHYGTSIQNFPGILASCSSEVKPIPGILAVQRRKHGLCDDPNYVGWNKNTGGSAVNVALHLGAKRIVLLGFDMHLDPEDGQANWHPNTKAAPDAGVYPTFLSKFDLIKADADRLFPKVEILNATPGSALTVFPMVRFEEVALRED